MMILGGRLLRRPPFLFTLEVSPSRARSAKTRGFGHSHTSWTVLSLGSPATSVNVPLSRAGLSSGIMLRSRMVSRCGLVLCAKTVFVGPNYIHQRPAPAGDVSRPSDFRPRVCQGATIGANATIVAGVTLGEQASRCGSVVIRDVPAHALVVGNLLELQVGSARVESDWIVITAVGAANVSGIREDPSQGLIEVASRFLLHCFQTDFFPTFRLCVRGGGNCLHSIHTGPSTVCSSEHGCGVCR